MDQDEMVKALLRNLERGRTRFNDADGTMRPWHEITPAAASFGEDETAHALKQPAEVRAWFLNHLAGTRAVKARYDVEDAAARSESHVEELLFLALLLVAEADSDIPVGVGREPDGHAPTSVRLDQQVEVGKFRVDFAVTAYAMGRDGMAAIWRKGYLLVEVDGHDFHDRTKEQASRDRARDRALTGAGFTVWRYTGSDVWKNPIKVAAEIMDGAFKRSWEGEIVHRVEPKDPR